MIIIHVICIHSLKTRHLIKYMLSFLHRISKIGLNHFFFKPFESITVSCKFTKTRSTVNYEFNI